MAMRDVERMTFEVGVLGRAGIDVNDPARRYVQGFAAGAWAFHVDLIIRPGLTSRRRARRGGSNVLGIRGGWSPPSPTTDVPAVRSIPWSVLHQRRPRQSNDRRS